MLLHSPWTGDPLNGEKERIAAIQLVDDINNKHHPRLFLMLLQGKVGNFDEEWLFPRDVQRAVPQQ